MDWDTLEHIRGLPWFVDVSFGEHGYGLLADGTHVWQTTQAGYKRKPAQDLRPPATGEKRPAIKIRGDETRKVPGLFIDDSGRFFDFRGKELPLLDLEIRKDEPGLSRIPPGHAYQSMIQAPADQRPDSPHRGSNQHWFMSAADLWRDNLPDGATWNT